MDIYLIYLFSALALFSGILVLISYNPVHSVLSLILVFCNSAAVLVILKIYFMAILLLIVYVGAVAVLFLFVVMMLDVKIIELKEISSGYLPLGFLLLLILGTQLYTFLTFFLFPGNTSMVSFFNLDNTWSYQVDAMFLVNVVGSLMYTSFGMHFILVSIILLLAMIGAINLTLYHRHDVKRQNVYEQVNISFSTNIKYYY